jgi:hypothetical protein
MAIPEPRRKDFGPERTTRRIARFLYNPATAT